MLFFNIFFIYAIYSFYVPHNLIPYNFITFGVPTDTNTGRKRDSAVHRFRIKSFNARSSSVTGNSDQKYRRPPLDIGEFLYTIFISLALIWYCIWMNQFSYATLYLGVNLYKPPTFYALV